MTALCSFEGEGAYFSAWSVMHFLSGYIFYIVLNIALPDSEDWVSLTLLLYVNLLFETLENEKTTGKIMWSWLGQYSEYSGDSCQNLLGDIAAVHLGWLTVKLSLVVMGTETIVIASTEFLGFLLIGIVLFICFVSLYRVEQRVMARKVAPRGKPLPLVTASV